METFSALLALCAGHRSPVNSPQKGQWRGALIFSLICACINGEVNNREAGDSRRNRAHYDVIVMTWTKSTDINRNIFGDHDVKITFVRYFRYRTVINDIAKRLWYWAHFFLIHMNDISNSSNLFKFVLFADDTNLFSTIEYILPTHTSNINELLNNELANIYELLTVKRITFNLTKTKIYDFSSHTERYQFSSCYCYHKWYFK